MSKVKLTIKESKDLEGALALHKGDKARLVGSHSASLFTSESWATYTSLNGMELEVLVKALYEGYEIDGVSELPNRFEFTTSFGRAYYAKSCKEMDLVVVMWKLNESEKRLSCATYSYQEGLDAINNKEWCNIREY